MRIGLAALTGAAVAFASGQDVNAAALAATNAAENNCVAHEPDRAKTLAMSTSEDAFVSEVLDQYETEHGGLWAEERMDLKQRVQRLYYTLRQTHMAQSMAAPGYERMEQLGGLPFEDFRALMLEAMGPQAQATPRTRFQADQIIRNHYEHLRHQSLDAMVAPAFMALGAGSSAARMVRGFEVRGAAPLPTEGALLPPVSQGGFASGQTIHGPRVQFQMPGVTVHPGTAAYRPPTLSLFASGENVVEFLRFPTLRESQVSARDIRSVQEGIARLSEPAGGKALRGVQHPHVREARAIGMREHEKLRADLRLKSQKNSNWGTGQILKYEDGGYGIPDGRAFIRPIELKPNTPSGVRKGQRQLQKYEEAAGKRGILVLYDKVTGKRTYVRTPYIPPQTE